MTDRGLDLRRPGLSAAIWAAGLAALLGMVVYSQATATPYPTSWPWLTFGAMAILEQAVMTPAGDRSSPTVSIVLVAAIIMFRKHPDITAMVTAAAGLAGGLLARLSWHAVLTRSAWLLLLGAAGTACIRLVGYNDSPHFVAATAGLVLVYVGTVIAINRSLAWPLRGLVAAVLGSLLALAWRTPATGPLMLRLGEVAILALMGMTIGFAMGGRPQDVLQRRMRLRGLPVLAILGGVGLVLSTRITGQSSTLLAIAGIASIGFHALVNRWFPVACMLLGALANEVVRLANGGRMPVETNTLPPGVVDELGNLSQTSTYQAANAGTHLAWLADRFPLAPFPGVASAGDAVIALGIIWVFASLTASRSAPAIADGVVKSMAA